MKINEIKGLQEAILYNIFFTEFGYYQFSAIESVVPHEVFGSYAKLAKIVYGKSYDDIQVSAMSTEIIKEGLAEQISHIMTIPFTICNIYDDIKILMREYIMNRPGDQFEKLVDIQSRFQTIETKRAENQSKMYQIRDLYDSAILDLSEKRKRLQSGKILGYSTGFPILDKLTDGLQKGTVTRVVAYANTGKSKFSYHITNKLLEQGANVLYFTLEVNQKTVIYNLMANKYNISMRDVYMMNFEDKDMGELFSKKLEIIHDKYSLSDIIQYTESRKPDAVVIDFVQNIEVGGGSEYEEMTTVARQIQQMAIKNNIAVFDLSQTSNEGARSDSDVISSKGSGALVASADIVMVMKRGQIEGMIDIKIGKNKFGARKSLSFSVNYENNTWKEIGEASILSNNKKL